LCQTKKEVHIFKSVLRFKQLRNQGDFEEASRPTRFVTAKAI